MSRSNPTSHSANPATRFFEWKGGDGKLVWYNKETKEVETVAMPKGFRFLVLDQLSTVTGYNDKMKSGIYSNEVRDVRADAMVVKLFQGGEIANGIWSNIKERVSFKDGKFACSVYIAFKDGDELKIGNIKMSGCALGPWFDFAKKNQSAINEKAIVIWAGEEVTKGSGRSAIIFNPPVFTVAEVSPETNEQAIGLDAELQEFLKGYLKRPIDDKLDQRTGHAAEDEREDPTDYSQERHAEPPARKAPPVDPDLDVPEDSDIPF